MSLVLPPRLATPVRADNGEFMRDILLDLTVYTEPLSEQQLDALVQWYFRFAPRDRRSLYMIEENTVWDSVTSPALLTNLGHAAARAGQPLPFLAPVRKRLADGRRHYLQFWDGARTRSWSLCIRALHLRETGLHAFVRLMLPADAEPKLLHDAALEWAELLPIRSGHAGVQLTYNQWHLYPAFDDIYALSRRYWGVDVEHMNGTLPRMKAHIKGVSWLTIVGHAWGSRPDIAPRISALSSRPDIQIDRGTNASVIRIGDAPVLGDQNHPTPELDGYYATASALEPLYLTAHPDFPGRFEDTGNTLGWIRRFLEPDDWR